MTQWRRTQNIISFDSLSTNKFVVFFCLGDFFKVIVYCLDILRNSPLVRVYDALEGLSSKQQMTPILRCVYWDSWKGCLNLLQF